MSRICGTVYPLLTERGFLLLRDGIGARGLAPPRHPGGSPPPTRLGEALARGVLPLHGPLGYVLSPSVPICLPRRGGGVV